MHNPEVQDQIIAEMKFWLDLGVAGFRFDACNHIFQDLQLRSNPPRDDVSAALHPYGFQVHMYDQGQPEMLPFLEKIRKVLDKYGAYSLAEVGGYEPIRLMGLYTQPGRLHSAYSFAMMQPDSSAQRVRDVITELEGSIVQPAAPCYALSNHDKPRVATRWQNGRDREQTAKEMLALLFAMRGDICMYQGEELGLPQSEVPYERLQDPFGKSFWPKFKGRDGCRTPMPWEDRLHGGFSLVEPWLPVCDEHRSMNVARQEDDPESVLNFYKKIIAVRRANPALMTGSISLIEAPHAVLAFRRQCEEQELLCLFNMDVVEHAVQCNYTGLLCGQHFALETNRVVLGVSGFCFLKIE
jgi:alpha-glucosidase